MDSLLFNFLDELLYGFCTDLFVCTEVQVTSLDREAWTLKAKGQAPISFGLQSIICAET